MNEIIKAETGIELLEHADTLHKQIYALKVLTEPMECETGEEYTKIASELSEIKALNKKLTDVEKSLCDPFKSAVKRLQGWNSEFFEIAEKAERNIKNAMLKWNEKQERIKKVEEARLKKLEDDRIAKEKAKLEKKIEKAELKGDTDKVESLEEQKDSIVPMVAQVQLNTPKVDTVNYAIRFSFEIENVNLIPREYMTPDEKKIRGVVTAMKELTDIPGVKVIQTKEIRSK